MTEGVFVYWNKIGDFKSEADQEKRIYEIKKYIDRCGKYRRSEKVLS